MWRRIGTSGGIFKCGNEPLDFIKSGGICWLAENLLASQEGFCSLASVVL